MATLLSNYSSGSNPSMLYTVTATETSRSSTSVSFSLTVSAKLENQTYSYFNGTVTPKINIGGATVTFSTLGTFPRGSGTKSSTKTVTVYGISATTSYISYTFSATQSLGGTSSSSTGYVSGKSGSVSISKYMTTPSLSGSITIKDGSTTVSKYFREDLGSDPFTLSWPSQTGGTGGTITYELEKSIDSGSYTDVSTTITGSPSYTISPGSSTAEIRYRVRARNTAGSETLYSSWIYSNTVKKNVLSAPTLTSSATVSYNTNSFTLTLGEAKDNMGSNMTYTITGKSYTTLSGSGTISPGTITINTNNGTSGYYITLANLKKAALAGSAHSDTNDYKDTLDFTVTANNGKSTKSTSVSVTLDLGKDAPVNPSTVPTVSIDSSSYYPINSTNYLIPEYKPIKLSIQSAIKDVLGRNCSFDVMMTEGTTDKLIKNTGIATAATSTTINHTEAGLLIAKKTVSFYVKAKTYNGITLPSARTENVDLHYYQKPSVTFGNLSRLGSSSSTASNGSSSFDVTVTRNSSISSASHNTVIVMVSGSENTTYVKTPSAVVNPEIIHIEKTGLADSFTSKVDVVITDPIGIILKPDHSNDVVVTVNIPKFIPMLSLREKGVGINHIATDLEMLRVGGNITIDMKPVTGVSVEGQQGALIFDTASGTTSNDQSIQLRYNSYNTTKSPFGLHIEKTSKNKETSNKAYLKVEGDMESDTVTTNGITTNNITTNNITTNGMSVSGNRVAAVAGASRNVVMKVVSGFVTLSATSRYSYVDVSYGVTFTTILGVFVSGKEGSSVFHTYTAYNITNTGCRIYQSVTDGKVTGETTTRYFDVLVIGYTD